MRYHVFIEGPRDPSPGSRERLAAALGQKYGMSPPAIASRLAKGRFCAWASLDVTTAQRLAAELEGLGAAYSLVEDGPGRQTVQGVAPVARTAAPYASGLAAAYAGSSDQQFDLGGDSGSWKLSRLDGTEGTGESPTLVAMEAAQRAAAPPPPRAKPPSTAPPMPLDPFAPPEMQREQQIELGDKPVASGTVAPASNPAAAVPVTSTYRGGPGSGSATLHRGNAWSRARELMAESSRARFAAGIAVAFLIGLIPAQLYAGWRRGIAFEEIQGELAEEYRRADTPELWSTLETAREDAEGLVAARQQRNAVGALLIWFLVGGGVAFVWFRLVDWEGAVPRLARSGPSARRA